MLIDTRLRKWVNDNIVLHDNQFGFVKRKSTVDCMFVLTSIIDKIVKHEKRKLYCSFVDLKNALTMFTETVFGLNSLNKVYQVKLLKHCRACIVR